MDEGNFRCLFLLSIKLWFSKLIELDVCGRPLFANPVTYIHVYIMLLFVLVGDNFAYIDTNFLKHQDE